MKVYDILSAFNYSQTYSVVAESMAEAEKAFLAEYPGTIILEIKLHAKYVLIAEGDQDDRTE